MEENLILVPLIRLGASVKIKPGTRFYDAGPGNPKDIPGKIVEGDSAWLSVRWENGRVNNYEEHDLIWDVPVDMAEVNANRIYFDDTKLELKTMDDVLYALYPPKKSGYSVETFYKVQGTGELMRQCKKEKMRSFDDIWTIADTYMPGISAEDAFRGLLLHKVTQTDIDRGVLFKSFANCSTMKRIRYTNSYSTLSTVMHSVDCNPYDSIYSWRQLFDMIGVKNNKELKEWYINQLKLEVDEAVCKVCTGEETTNDKIVS